MPNVVITGHGGRKSGTSKGSYVIPPGVTVYFFTKDKQLLNSDGSDLIMDNLCCDHPREQAVRNIAVEVKTAYETIPNYIAYGTNDFRDPTGAYEVGQPVSNGPFSPITNGTQKYLSDIIGGQSSNGVIGSHIYWLCCRDAPITTNSTDITVATDLQGHILGGNISASVSGLKPSEVKQTGKWQ